MSKSGLILMITNILIIALDIIYKKSFTQDLLMIYHYTNIFKDHISRLKNIKERNLYTSTNQDNKGG